LGDKYVCVEKLKYSIPFDLTIPLLGIYLEKKVSLLLVAHTHNPSYSGGRDQEAHGLKPAPANTLSRKNPSQKRAGGLAQDVGPEFKPQYHPPTHKVVIQVAKNM
jgi:hypothetical protein